VESGQLRRCPARTSADQASPTQSCYLRQPLEIPINAIRTSITIMTTTKNGLDLLVAKATTGEDVPGLVELEVAVPRLTPASR